MNLKLIMTNWHRIVANFQTRVVDIGSTIAHAKHETLPKESRRYFKKTVCTTLGHTDSLVPLHERPLYIGRRCARTFYNLY
nr:hypothetical protein [Tanacetum cinerariifolium]